MRCISLVFVLSDVYFLLFFFFFFNDTATTEIYTLSLHDALPISVVEKDDVAGLLAAEHTPAAQHLFENVAVADGRASQDRKSTRLNSSHGYISYAVFCLKKKKKQKNTLPLTYSCQRASHHQHSMS